MHTIRRHTRRLALLTTLVATLALFGAIVRAQGGTDDPEGGLPSISEPGAPAADQLELQPDPAAPSTEVTLFKFIAGQSFHPRESSTTVQYGGAGCIYRTSASGYVISDLQLPEGAEIDFIRLFFYDANVDQDIDLYFYSYDGMGLFEEIATLSSEGAPDQSTVDDDTVSHVVDNASEALGLVVGMDAANDSTVRFCGVRVRYTIDVPSYTLMPAVLKEGTGE